MTHIILIPKKKHIETRRQISLCNVMYKIVAKALANRLKIFLPTVISQSRGAFIQGRSITDNILLSTEVIHFLKRKTQGKLGYTALK